MEGVSHHTPRAVLASLVLALPMVVLSASPSSADHDCTIVGTAGPDRLVGTAGADVICGRGGSDELIGRGGDDRFSPGPGRDVIRGGGGNDTVHDLPPVAADVFEGGAGTDRFSYLDREAGVQVSLDGVADDGEDGEGDNVGSDVESVTGTWDYADVLVGNASANVLDGGGGNDVLHGGDGDDRLIGGKDIDTLFGEAGDDTLLGGSYHDLLVGGPGADRLDGQGTSTPYKNVCDLDTSDPTVLSCVQDGSAPVVRLQTNHRAYRPGDDLYVGGSAVDAAGVTGIQLKLVRVSDDATLDICPARMKTGMAKEPYRPRTDWQWDCTLPADMEPGAYLLRSVAQDRLGQQSGLAELGPGDLAFIVLGDEPDSTPPAVTVTGVSDSDLSPGEDFWVDVAISDPSGINQLYVEFTGPAVPTDLCDFSGWLTEGTIQDGTWRVHCTVPKFVRNTTYPVVASASDGHGNYGSSDDTGPEVTVTGGADDDTPPVIHQVVVQPGEVQPSEKYSVKVRATDATGMSGNFAMRITVGQNGFTVVHDCTGAWLVSGTAKDGTWKVLCTVPADAPAGTGNVQATAQDRVGWSTTHESATFTIS